MAVISPHRSDVVNVTQNSNQTNNVIEFFSPINNLSKAQTGVKNLMLLDVVLSTAAKRERRERRTT